MFSFVTLQICFHFILIDGLIMAVIHSRVVLYSTHTDVFRLRVLYRGLYWERNRKNRLKQSRDISLGIMIGLRSVCSIPGDGRRFFSLTQLVGKQCVISTLVLSGYRKRSFHVVKGPGREFTTRLHLKRSLKTSGTCAFRVVSLGWLLIKHTDNFYIYISLNFPCGQKITEGRNARSEKRLEVGIPPERQVSLFIRGTKLFTRFPKILRCNWISRSIHRTWGFAISFRSRHSIVHSLLARWYTHTHTRTHTHIHTHTHTNTYTHIHTHTHTHIHTHTYTHTRARTHAHAQTHARTHKHTHTGLQRFLSYLCCCNKLTNVCIHMYITLNALWSYNIYYMKLFAIKYFLSCVWFLMSKLYLHSPTNLHFYVQ